MIKTTQSQAQPQAPHDEHILVVKRQALFPEGAFHGIQPVDDNTFLSTVTNHKEFHPRSLMETDPRYKQIIPYIVFNYQDHYFLMQRQAKATETRLQNKFTLGIGGHMRQEDLVGHDIFGWARREFNEEVAYDGALKIKPLGLLNDDTNDVGKVHVGFVLLVTGDSTAIAVKSELKSGELMTLDQIHAHYDQMESWSQFIFDFMAPTAL